MIPSGYAVL